MPAHSTPTASLNRRKPGPRPRVTRDDIARAALDIGLNTATIKALAAHLGMDHSSLYRHVKNRDEIIAAAADLALSELDWQALHGGWRAMLEQLSDAIWSLYERYPGLAMTFREMQVMPPACIRGFSETVALLQTDGFALDEAILAVDTLFDGLTDCFTGWQRFTQPGKDGESPADIMKKLWETEALTDRTHAPQIRGMIAVMQGEPREWWLKRRGLILDGIGGLKGAQPAKTA